MLRNIPPLVCWGVWLTRNKSILRDNASSSSHIATYIVAIFSMMHSKVLVPTVQRIEVEEINQQIPWAYFDGACNDQGMCSGGIMLFLDSHHSLKSKVGLGRETNNFVELLTLKLLVCWALELGCRFLQIFGDSLNVVNWFNVVERCHNITLLRIYDENVQLKSSFDIITC